MILSEICSIATGYTTRGRLEPAQSGGSLAIQMRDVQEGRGLDTDNLQRCKFDTPVERYLVHGGEIIFKSRGESNTAMAIEQLSEPAVAILPLFILRPKDDVVLPDYLAWAINQRETQRRLDAEAQGTGVRMISKSTLERIELPLPDIETQRLIVAIADLAYREGALLQELANRREQLSSLILAKCARKSRKKETRQ
ncbi:restriction endonuclease subunit S [Ruegeria intermedia]|uniref:restriction endonuclease subunit S n=1 Tax=Ruegeria intermedia TaxID=996115 RepID=UPI00122C24A3|nr:restriction endonuclease subunit S [Ruegeria intermedia]